METDPLLCFKGNLPSIIRRKWIFIRITWAEMGILKLQREFHPVYHPLIITRVKRSTARIQQATSWLESQPLGRETSPATLTGLCTGPPITIRLLAQGITITPDCGDNDKISTKSKEVFIFVFSWSMCIWHNGQKCSTLIYHGQNSVHTL